MCSVSILNIISYTYNVIQGGQYNKGSKDIEYQVHPKDIDPNIQGIFSQLCWFQIYGNIKGFICSNGFISESPFWNGGSIGKSQ